MTETWPPEPIDDLVHAFWVFLPPRLAHPLAEASLWALRRIGG